RRGSTGVAIKQVLHVLSLVTRIILDDIIRITAGGGVGRSRGHHVKEVLVHKGRRIRIPISSVINLVLTWLRADEAVDGLAGPGALGAYIGQTCAFKGQGGQNQVARSLLAIIPSFRPETAVKAGGGLVITGRTFAWR